MVLKLLLLLYLCDYYSTNVPKKKHFLFFLILSVDKREHQCYYKVTVKKLVVQNKKKSHTNATYIRGGDGSLKKILFNPNRLKAERIARNLSQEEVAMKLGKNRTWLAKRENGNVDVGADDLAAIATVLKVDDLSIFFT